MRQWRRYRLFLLLLGIILVTALAIVFRPGKPVEYPPGWPLAYVQAPGDARAYFATSRKRMPLNVPAGQCCHISKMPARGGGLRTTYSTNFTSGKSWVEVCDALEQELGKAGFDRLRRNDKKVPLMSLANKPLLQRILIEMSISEHDYVQFDASYISADNRYWVDLYRTGRAFELTIKEFNPPMTMGSSPVLLKRKPIKLASPAAN